MPKLYLFLEIETLILCHYIPQKVKYCSLSSSELKASVSFSDRLLPVVRPSSVCRFHLLKDHWANFNQTWRKASLGEGYLKFYK